MPSLRETQPLLLPPPPTHARAHNWHANHAIPATAHASPLLRKAALVSFLPALPLCITHAALSADVVPAVGLVPLFFSAGLSLFLVVSGRRGEGEVWKGKGRARAVGVGHDDEEEVEEEEEREREDLEGCVAVDDRGIEPDEDERDDRGGAGLRGLLTHRITVFVADAVLAAALMVVLVFTWTGAGRRRWRYKAPELAMLAAYGTVPLLVNFLIHLYLAVREFVAGLAIPGLVEYTAWRAVPADCPHCGNRLRPDSLPPIPWYETVSRPNVSLSQIRAPSISRPSFPGLNLPRFPAFKRPRVWKVPAWMRGRSQEDATLFVDDEQAARDRYRDDPGPPNTTTVVATGSAGPAPVVEEVVGKKDKKGKAGLGALSGSDDASWP